jgi:hypothetical protein
MQKRMSRPGWTWIAAAVIGLAGCGKSSDSSTASSGATTSAAASRAKPGYIVGKVTRADGSPISIPGVHITVTVNGVAGTGNDVTYLPQVDANGTFSLPLASGIYHQVLATIKVPFNGTFYYYNLVPTTMTGDTQSDAGIISDFSWHVSGPLWTVKDSADPTNFTQWYGGCCTLQWFDVEVPVGAKFVFTGTPLGTAVDGSDVKPLNWTCTWGPLGLAPTVLNDMPATSGGWHITGKETDPDGKTYSVGFKSPVTQQYVAGADIQFQPNPQGTAGFSAPPLWISRAAQ